MKRNIFFMFCACLLMASTNAQAQSKFGNFLKKVNKALEETNQKLEDVNNTLDGKVLSTASNGKTKTLSPSHDLQLEFVECYDEGHDVVVVLKITNTTDKEIGLNWGGGKGYDNLGDTYEFDYNFFTIGGEQVSPSGVGIPSDIPLKALIRLKDVNAEATSIKKVEINTYQYKGFEVRNIPITRGQETGQNISSGSDASDATSVLSPTRQLKLEYKDNLIEGSNNVLINFLMTNTQSEETYLNWGGGRAWDDQGNMYEFGGDEFTVGGKAVGPTGVPVPGEIPVKCEILLKGVSKNAKIIKLIKFDTYQFKGFEIKNIPVNWEGK